MTVEEWNQSRATSQHLDGWEVTEIECPKCSAPLCRGREIQTSYPATFKVRCTMCTYEGVVLA